MSEDDVFKDKLRITFKKSKHSEVPGRTTLTEGFVHPAEMTRSGTDIGQIEGSNSDVSFVLKEEERPNQYGTLVVSKARQSRITKEGEMKEITPLQTRSDDLLKEEIVRSILEEMFVKMEEIGTLSKASSRYYFDKSTSQISKPATHVMTFANRPPTKTSSCISRDHKEKKLEKNRKRHVASVVKELELPVNLSKSKPSVESRPKFERLVLDTLVATSSTIITKPEERSVSATSQPRPSRDGSIVALSEEIHNISSPFELCWCFGFNAEVPVINLSNADSSQVAFANSQYAVIYDFHEDTMSFLQGHVNSVSCISMNPTGSLIVTADSGSDVGTSRIIVWDRRPCVLQVLDNAHPHGCQHVGFNANGEFLISVSANEIPASIKVWEWEKDAKNPSASTTVKESLGNVKQLTTHPNLRSEFAVTFERSVIFARVAWQTVFETSHDARVSERIKDCEFCVSSSTPPKVGSLTDTTFLEDTEAIALSSTCKGYVIVWEDNMSSRNKKTYRKYVRLHLDCITNIKMVDNKIAVATVSGNVSFYDLDLKILFFHKLLQEPLVSISFNLTSQHSNVTACGEHPSCANTWKREPRKLVDASLKSEPFSVRHFVISTDSGKIAYVNASCGTPKFLPFPSKEMFTAIDMMPNSKFLCAGTASGKCILFDTDHRKVKLTHKINVQANLCQAVSFLKYSPSGYTLACGMYTGDIWLLDPLLLRPILDSPLTDCNCCITQIVFSSNSEYLVVTDVSFCISVYFLGEKPVLIDQYIAHYKTIVSVIINPVEPGEKEIKLFTVSSDRSICVFVIDREKKSFEFILNQRVEQTSVPMCSVNYPQPYSSSGIYLGVNNDCKFRLHDHPTNTSAQAGVTRRCRGTIQAPDFGSPINYLEAFENNNKPYIFFKTKNHIGIHLLPVDGNPFRALGFRASPTDITCCTINPDGKYVFTISESFSGISMWKINTRAVEDFYKSGGEGLEPFLKMLGEEKEREIRDFFDLGQFLHQGESPSLVRTLRNSLPICEVANVLQALGCLLTKQEISEMTNEVVTSDLENPSYNIEYDEFVRLYLNYRRTQDLTIKDLRKAFRDFYAGLYFATSCPADFHIADSSPVFDSVSFMQKLLVSGEEMTLEDLYTDFSILTGGHQETPGDEHLMFQVPPTMPKEISFVTFVKDILGFSVDESVFND